MPTIGQLLTTQQGLSLPVYGAEVTAVTGRTVSVRMAGHDAADAFGAQFVGPNAQAYLPQPGDYVLVLLTATTSYVLGIINPKGP